jgi:hypothetical protein
MLLILTYFQYNYLMAKVGFALLLVALCIVLGGAGNRVNFVADIESNSDFESDTILKSRGAILAFLESGNYTYSESRHDIPKEVLDILRSYTESSSVRDTSNYSESNHDIDMEEFHLLLSMEESFRFGDRSVEDSVYLGCMLNSFVPFNKLLHFVAYNDSVCLLSYLKGGFVTHRKVELIQYKGNVKRTAIDVDYDADDISKLKVYLNDYPNIKRNYRRPKRVTRFYIRDKASYSKSFINKFMDWYSSYDSVSLINDSIIINGNLKKLTKIRTDLPLNKTVKYKSKVNEKVCLLEVTRINISTVKYHYKEFRNKVKKYDYKGLAELKLGTSFDMFGLFSKNEIYFYGTDEYVNTTSKHIHINFPKNSLSPIYIKFQRKNGKPTYSPELTIQP